MSIRTLVILSFICCLACKPDTPKNSEILETKNTDSISFDQTKWAIKKGKDYPYRSKMVGAVLYNDTIRSLTKTEIYSLLGQPDRTNELYLYYTIDQKRIGFWPLHTRTLVIKLLNDNKIEWIKIHG